MSTTVPIRFKWLVAVVALWSASPSAHHHFALIRSAPAHLATVRTAPSRLQLWFTQRPAAGVSQLTLATDRGDIPLSRTSIVGDEKSMFADPLAPLTPGRYKLHWRGAGDDGHVQAGDIVFTVAPR